MTSQDQGISSSLNRYMTIPRVLVFLEHNRQLLLLKGAATKKIWPNLYNGVGGHVEMGESIQQTALREIEEETGLAANLIDRLLLKAVVNIVGDHDTVGILMFVFHGAVSTQKVTPSDEGTLEWHSIDDLPFDEMVPDLPSLIPVVIGHDAADPLFGRYYYDEGKLITKFDGS